MNLLHARLYRANVLPAGETEYLSWIAYFAEEKRYFDGVDAYLNGEGEHHMMSAPAAPDVLGAFINPEPKPRFPHGSGS